jgi:regulator of protease activity HflC (stomatin/prohibitin superfamily)
VENQINLLIVLAIMCCVPLPFLLLAIAPIFFFIQIIPEYQRAVTTHKKWGGEIVTKVHNPGFLFLNLFTTKLFRVDMREIEKNTEAHAISKPDNTKINIQTRWAYRVVDPIKGISLPSVDKTLEGLAVIILREIIQDLSIESIQAEQLHIEEKWLNRMNDTASDKWGVKVFPIEIQKITKVTLEVV